MYQKNPPSKMNGLFDLPIEYGHFYMFHLFIYLGVGSGGGFHRIRILRIVKTVGQINK